MSDEPASSVRKRSVEHVHPAATIRDCPACLAALQASRLRLDERLALALAEDCFTELDDADRAYVIGTVLPVALRYGARMEAPGA